MNQLLAADEHAAVEVRAALRRAIARPDPRLARPVHSPVLEERLGMTRSMMPGTPMPAKKTTRLKFH